MHDFVGSTPYEMSFSRGDFFHVIDREDDLDWYEACNPALPDARGLVPVCYFQALGRTEREGNHDSGYSDSNTVQPAPGSSGPHVPPSLYPPFPPSKTKHGMVSPPMQQSFQPPPPASSQPNPGAAIGHRASKSVGKTGAMVYGIVMYDFAAERADELEAAAGEAIIVIAQSNPEWFVAKPIGRLGGPGLIPVSFVEIRDMASGDPIRDPSEAIRQAGVPKVEEWKKMAAEYKNSSITLGKFEGGNPSDETLEKSVGRMSLQQQQQQQQAQQRQSQQRQPMAPPGSRNGQPQQQHQYASNPEHIDPNEVTQLYFPIKSSIPRYCFAEDKYWFVIDTTLEDGRRWELSRYYEDFYDFQIALLGEFPREAGNTGAQKRSLPYMPGPVSYVTDSITEGRLHNLDAYVKNLLGQPDYIAKSTLVKQFFAPREGDYEVEADPSALDQYRQGRDSQPSSTGSAGNGPSNQSSAQNLSGGYAAGQRQPSGSAPGGAGQVIKIKMYFNNDLIALRMPANVQFRQLTDKVRERLKLTSADQLQLFYKDEGSGSKLNLMSDNDLSYAMQRNEKLLLFAEVM